VSGHYSRSTILVPLPSRCSPCSTRGRQGRRERTSSRQSPGSGQETVIARQGYPRLGMALVRPQPSCPVSPLHLTRGSGSFLRPMTAPTVKRRSHGLVLSDVAAERHYHEVLPAQLCPPLHVQHAPSPGLGNSNRTRLTRPRAPPPPPQRGQISTGEEGSVSHRHGQARACSLQIATSSPQRCRSGASCGSGYREQPPDEPVSCSKYRPTAVET
jgi:hypothetical protein